MVLADHRAIADPLLVPTAERLAQLGVRPDHLTWTGLVVAFGAGLAFLLATPASPGLLGVAAALVALNAFLDAVDGKLARRAGLASPRGDYLDHAVDRFADAAILVGLALSPYVQTWIGLLAIVGMLLTSYLGTQAQAVGLGRNLGGLLGRADRLVILVVAPALQVGLVRAGIVPPGGPQIALGPLTLLSILDAAVLLIALLGLLTAAQRFVSGLRGL